MSKAKKAKTVIMTAIVDGEVQAWIREYTPPTGPKERISCYTVKKPNLPAYIRTKGKTEEYEPIEEDCSSSMNSDGVLLLYLGEYSST